MDSCTSCVGSTKYLHVGSKSTEKIQADQKIKPDLISSNWH